MTTIYDGMRSKEHSDKVKKSLRIMKKQGYKLGPPLKATAIDIDLIIRLRRQGKAISYIASKVGLSVGLTHKLIHRFKCYILTNQSYSLMDLWYE